MTAMRVSFLLCVVFSTSYATFDINKDVVIQSCDRTIDLTSQVVKIQHKLSVANNGKGAVKSFLFSYDPALKDRIAFVGATVGTSDKTYLRVTDAKVQGHTDKPFWQIELKDAISPGGSGSVSVEIVLGKAQEMYPAEITQKEKQFARFSGNHYVYLPYTVTTQTTTVQLASSNVESYTKLKPSSQQDSTIKFGPYPNIAPFSVSDMVIHAENNNQMLVVTNLLRVIEVSMWGNIAIEETIDIKHNGAVLKGSFSRYEFQRESSGVSSVKNFKTLLPAAARDVYYRDDIGNISTSHMKVMMDAVELDLRPRFPLFGGWKTHYVIGYNVPSYEYLFYKGDLHVLNMRLIDHVYDDMLVENAEVRVILPEAVEGIKVETPYPMKRREDEKHFTYLDTVGRTVVVMKSVGQLTEHHIQDFQLQFFFKHRSMMNEPLVLVLVFFLLFVLSVIYVRLDFSISVDEGAEARMKVAGYCEKVASHQDSRGAQYQALEDAIAKLKSYRDSQAFQNTVKKIANDHKNETSAIADLQGVIKTVNADLADKVNELQKYDKVYRDLQTQHIALVDKLIANKVQKPAFVDQETAINKKKGDALEKINGIVRSL